MNQQKIMQAFATWAQSKNIPPPQTKAGRQVLFARFMNEVASRADQVIGGFNPTQGHRADDGETVHLVRNGGGGIDITEPRNPHDYSDFDQMIDEREHAMHEAHGDDLAMNVIHRNKTQAADNALAPFMRINPQSWQGQNIGNQITINAVQTQEMVRWTGDPIENIPVMVSAQAQPLLPANNAKLTYGQWYRPYLILQYGSRGGLINTQVDVTLGRGFVVNGSQISVQAAMDPNINPTDATTSMQFTTMLSCYAAGPAVLPTRTTYFDGPSAGVKLTGAQLVNGGGINIPNNAVNFVFFQDTAGAGATIDIYSAVGGFSLYTITVAAGANVTVPVPLPGDAAFFILTALGGGFNHARLTFGLSL